MENPMVLMTTHGTILCIGPAGLYHVAIDDLGKDDAPLMVGLADVARTGRHERMLTRTDTPLTFSDVAGLPPQCDLLLDPGRRTATLRQDDNYYSAEPMNRTLARDRPQAGLWERFLLVTEEDFSCLRHVFNNDWVVASSCKVVRAAEITIREGHLLSFGELELDLRYNLPLLPNGQRAGRDRSTALSYTVLVDGWKIDRLHLYKPMIFFTAFGSPYALDQAFTAIGSLIEFGGYDGHVHVITDQPREVFANNLPNLPDDRLSTQSLASHDWVGYVAAKYAILDNPDAYAFQPLLFLDTDVVADAPLEPLLATVVCLESISAPLENVSSLQTNPSVGASLIQRAGLEARFACGVNGGTVGIPNLETCVESLDLIRTIITNHSELFGRDHFRWVDQEVLNYVSFSVGRFNSSALLRFIRYGWENDEFDGSRRLGLVHFWPPVTNRPKLDRMRDYMDTLRA